MVKRIWLAEDDSDDIDLFVEALTDIDKSIVYNCARNGKELIAKLNIGESDFPELIFLDVNMPEMNGWECLAYLKKNPTFKDIPVIIYSTSSAKTNTENAVELGAFCFYEKPSNYTILREFLEIIVKSNLEKSNVIDNLAKGSRQKVYFN